MNVVIHMNNGQTLTYPVVVMFIRFNVVKIDTGVEWITIKLKDIHNMYIERA